ncbi:unnamed protein product [Nesidiocoris tenuis]|uniref:Uncharacterized protein n=1 Tax=Nesidiocoris tenuis TaxID=355587 RepID=A0A6H5H1W0_9HEMI|nr:unnamed protein product [Nesidiocoris tenuis]
MLVLPKSKSLLPALTDRNKPFGLSEAHVVVPLCRPRLILPSVLMVNQVTSGQPPHHTYDYSPKLILFNLPLFPKKILLDAETNETISTASKWKYWNRPKIKNRNGDQKKLFLIHIYSESLPEQVSVCPSVVIYNQWGQHKASLTRFKTFVENFDLDNDDVTLLQVKFEKIEPVWNSFDTVQTEIELAVLDEDDNVRAAEDNERIKFEDDFALQISKAKSIIACKSGRSDNVSSYSAREVATTHDTVVNLPKINLPTFDGKWEEFCSFREDLSPLLRIELTCLWFKNFDIWFVPWRGKRLLSSEPWKLLQRTILLRGKL